MNKLLMFYQSVWPPLKKIKGGKKKNTAWRPKHSVVDAHAERRTLNAGAFRHRDCQRRNHAPLLNYTWLIVPRVDGMRVAMPKPQRLHRWDVRAAENRAICKKYIYIKKDFSINSFSRGHVFSGWLVCVHHRPPSHQSTPIITERKYWRNKNSTFYTFYYCFITILGKRSRVLLLIMDNIQVFFFWGAF